MKPFNNRKRRLLTIQTPLLTSYRSACFFIILTSFTILFLNYHVYHFHGFSYIIQSAITFFYTTLILKISTQYYEPLKQFEFFANDSFKLFACYLLLMLATTAIQYTPFELIDFFLFKHETLHLITLIDWTKAHPYFFDKLVLVYNSLNSALLLVPLSFLMLRRTDKVDSFCRYMIFTTIIGFVFYFFFPSCGPAHLYDKTHFLAEQINNYQKYFEIHHGLSPNQVSGGMIACPSFHVIWAWACARLFISNQMIFPLALTWFLTVSASTILLGWHYSIDVFGALLIISSYEICSIWFLKRSPY